MELLYTLTLFSLIGFIAVIVYLFLERVEKDKKGDNRELLEERLERLEHYVYELEQRLDTSSDAENEAIKERIIAMYEEGKELFLIENIVNVPRPKIEMILKSYQLKNK